MDNGTKEGLTLLRMPCGGYIVQDVLQPHDFCTQLFASSSIDEALKFIRDKVLPIETQAGDGRTDIQKMMSMSMANAARPFDTSDPQ